MDTVSHLFTPASTTQSSQPVLLAQEHLYAKAALVGLYEGDNKIEGFQSGTLFVSNLRIVWVDSITSLCLAIDLQRITKNTSQGGFLRQSPKIILHITSIAQESVNNSPWICGICNYSNSSQSACMQCGVKRPVDDLKTSCVLCTFINELDAQNCEMCGHALNNGVQTTEYVVKLSFRGSGMLECQQALEKVLKEKIWAKTKSEDSPSAKSVIGGVSGILQSMDQLHVKANQAMQTSFQDLENLMAKAGEMTRLAEQITNKLRAKDTHADTDGDESPIFNSDLSEFGIISPVTKQNAGSKYHDELAHELDQFLQRYCKNRSISMIAMTDAYCLFNRARGVSLVSPTDLYRASLQLETLSLSFRLKRFESGVLVLKSSHYDDNAIANQILLYIEQEVQGLTTSAYAKKEGCSVLVAKENLLVTFNLQ
jgi:ESCRT-II complex subunit VPS36